ncbi:MAG TPA: hypothetical protein PK971_04405 [Saprospiraceae bacterium]|nr:hypothetical protein [Saprospiraceae bacterium]HND87543.1 hypothetical protein [Saprospiraceae bacterium]
MELNLLETIRSLIQKNDLKKALFLLEQEFRRSDDTKYLNDVITWQAQLSEAEEKRSKNLITEEEYRINRARILAAILDLLTDMPPTLLSSYKPTVSRKAKLAHNIPAAMQVGQLYLCHIKMAENKKDLVIHAGDADRTLYELKGVENLMEVHLESVEKGAFWVKPAKHVKIQQDFAVGSVAEWAFDVVPQQPGRHHLRLNVVAVVNNHGKKQSRSQIMSIGVEVAVNTAQSVIEWKPAMNIAPVTLYDRAPAPGKRGILTSAMLVVGIVIFAAIIDKPQVWTGIKGMVTNILSADTTTVGQKRQVRLFIISSENTQMAHLNVSGGDVNGSSLVSPHTWGAQIAIPMDHRGSHHIEFKGNHSEKIWEVDTLYDGYTLYTSLKKDTPRKECGLIIHLDSACIATNTPPLNWRILAIKLSQPHDTMSLRAYTVSDSTLYVTLGKYSNEIVNIDEPVSIYLKSEQGLHRINTTMIYSCKAEMWSYCKLLEHKTYSATINWDREILIDSIFMNGILHPNLKPSLPQNNLIVHGIEMNTEPSIRIVGGKCICSGTVRNKGNHTQRIRCKCSDDVAVLLPPTTPKFSVTLELSKKWMDLRNDLRLDIDGESYLRQGIYADPITHRITILPKIFPPKGGTRRFCVKMMGSFSTYRPFELDCIDLPIGRHHIVLNEKNQLIKK